jgi:hypothetical protein
MFLSEGLQRFPRRIHAACSNILEPLSDTLSRIRLRREVEQALIGCRVLYDSGGLAVDRQHNRAFRFLELLQKRSGIIPKRSQCLNILRDVHVVMLPIQYLKRYSVIAVKFRQHVFSSLPAEAERKAFSSVKVRYHTRETE